MPRHAHIFDAVLPLLPELPHAPRTETGLPPAALNAACCRQTAPRFWSVSHDRHLRWQRIPALLAGRESPDLIVPFPYRATESRRSIRPLQWSREEP